MDRRKWTLGVSRFKGFAAHIPQSISEDYVQEYHAILALLEEASGQALSQFKISPDRLKREITSVRMGGFRRGRGRATYSDKRFCDSDYFRAQVHALEHYIGSIRDDEEDSDTVAVHRYERLSDDQLQDLLINRSIAPKSVIDGGRERFVYDRAHAIDELLKYDRKTDRPAARHSPAPPGQRRRMTRSAILEHFLLCFGLETRDDRGRPASIAELLIAAQKGCPTCTDAELLDALHNLNPVNAEVNKFVKDARGSGWVSFERSLPAWKDFFYTGYFNIRTLPPGRRVFDDLSEQIEHERRQGEASFATGRQTVEQRSEPMAAKSAIPTPKQWDVFISHAHEDKEEVAHPLAIALIHRGFKVWYDKFTLKLGDSLRTSIDRGLAESRFGVVILSPNFFAKHWPNQELNGLAAIEVGGRKVILPIWHHVTHADVLSFSPTLADRMAANTTGGIPQVVAAIEEVVNPPISADLNDSLRQAEERLQEYRCGVCGAPLSQRSTVQLSERDDGTFESFECGYSHIDGYMETPCPSDPKFPRPEDFDFVCQELVGDSNWKWHCFATGKTDIARKLSLASGLGRTKEEAQQKVLESYAMYVKPWKK